MRQEQTIKPDLLVEQMGTEELLDTLDIERRKFTKASDEVMHQLVNELVQRDVYPAMSRMDVPAFRMVESYGAHWYKWAEPLECPSCHADLRDHEHGPPFKLESFNNRSLYCPQCGHRWASK